MKLDFLLGMGMGYLTFTENGKKMSSTFAEKFSESLKGSVKVGLDKAKEMTKTEVEEDVSTKQ